MTAHRRDHRMSWPRERVLFAVAGAMTLANVLLAALVTSWFLALTAVVGISRLLDVLVSDRPLSIVLRPNRLRQAAP